MHFFINSNFVSVRTSWTTGFIISFILNGDIILHLKGSITIAEILMTEDPDDCVDNG